MIINFNLFLRKYFCTTGLILATIFFALSLTPSLLPRTNFYQGLLSGISTAIGYGLGVFLQWLWLYFQLPKIKAKILYRIQIAVITICFIFASIYLWKASEWQNSIRALMNLKTDIPLSMISIGLISLLVFILLLLIGRLFLLLFRFSSKKLKIILPYRVSNVLGFISVLLLFWITFNGLLFSKLLDTIDSSYEQIDKLIEPEFEKPSFSNRTGSDASLLDWETMGRHGRRFLAYLPDNNLLKRISGAECEEPIRVYVGMNISLNFEERSKLALEELLRQEAFKKSILVIITPTGTGWVDNGSILPLEVLHRGSVASVAAQYSYLPSPLALLIEREYGEEMAIALFKTIYNYWTTLPNDERPQLYLNGLSLGALNSDKSFELMDIINDPFNGALWVGPPFRKETWRKITKNRNPDSPAWLPTFKDQSVVRFFNQEGTWDDSDAPWGSFRIAYLQYASDPITFFSPNYFNKEPDWMKNPRGKDVTPKLKWFPIITMLQLAADMSSSTAPKGYGHEYASAHYFDVWYALTEPKDWSKKDLEQIRQYFENMDSNL